jgi:enoyl-CoA hydratase/carnithine racemase
VSSDTLIFDLTGHVAVITLNRPAVRNAMNRELSRALVEALQRVRDEPEIRVAVLSGENLQRRGRPKRTRSRG